MLKAEKRKEIRNKRKFGTNPVTGEVLNKRTFKLAKKYGIKDDGSYRSKYEASNKINRLERTKKRKEVQTIRAQTGNTFGNSLSQMFSSIFGGSPGQDEYEEEY